MNIETANHLVELRRERGLSQEDLAASLGVSRQAVSKWERAESSPDTDNLIALARLYGVSLDELVFRGGEGGGGEGGGAAAAARAQPQAERDRPGDEDAEILEAAARWDAADEAFSRKRRARWKKALLVTPYPVVITLVYLALGFGLGWWHPGWMLYLTVPIYYCAASAL